MEDVETFIGDLLERAKSLRAKVKCNKQLKEFVVKSEVITEEKANKLIQLAKNLELKGDNGNLVKIYRSLAQYYHLIGNDIYRSFISKMKDAIHRRNSHNPEIPKPVELKNIEMNIIDV